MKIVRPSSGGTTYIHEEVTAITWPSKHPNEVVFSLAEGRVKVGQLKSNKAATLFQSESFVVSLCSGMDGNSVLSGHLDGTVNRFIFATETSAPVQTRIARVGSCVPYALTAGATVCVAGSDRIVRFYAMFLKRFILTFG